MHLLAMATMLALPTLLHAQTVRGSVTDERDMPVAGVVVQLLDGRGNVVTRVLSNQRGEYRMTAPRDGSYRVRTQRIGFRPAVYGPWDLKAGADVTQPLALTGLPVTLSTVSVVGESACRALGDSTAATFLVWEQARTALMATHLSAATRTRTSTTNIYQRVLNASGSRILEQNSSIRSASGSQPWRSLPPETIHASGYIVGERDGSMVYYAPDLEVLLSDQFLEDHCVRMAPAADAGRIGISFEPTPTRRGIPEVSGTVWVDRRTSELRSLDYHYINIPRERAENAGGNMEFARTNDGSWVISRWEIRLPVLERRSNRGSVGGLGAMPLSEYRVTAIKVSAGELLAVRQGRDTLWARPPIVLAGSVVDSATGAPVAGARVKLVGTSLVAVTDATGRFGIDDVLPGAYTVEVRTPSLDSVGIVHETGLGVTTGDSAFRIRTPSARQLAATLCANDERMVRAAAVEPRGMVAGSVRTLRDSVSLRNATVVAEWPTTSTDAGLAAESAKRVQWREAPLDSRGMFRICGVPVNTALTLRAEADAGSSAPVRTRIPASQTFTHASLTLDDAADHGAVFAGMVLDDSSRRPIANVELALPALSRTALTNDEGMFRLADIPPGEHQVVLRRIGYSPVDTKVEFTANRTVERRIFLSSLVALQSVFITAERSALPDFDANRKRGMGYFLTRADLEKLKGRKLSDVIARAPGAQVSPGAANQVFIVTSRGARAVSRMARGGEADLVTGSRATECYTQVYVDNILMYAGRKDEPPFDINTIPTEQVEAIEFYSGPSQTPPKYITLNSACGVVVVHTRRKM